MKRPPRHEAPPAGEWADAARRMAATDGIRPPELRARLAAAAVPGKRPPKQAAEPPQRAPPAGKGATGQTSQPVKEGEDCPPTQPYSAFAPLRHGGWRDHPDAKYWRIPEPWPEDFNIETWAQARDAFFDAVELGEDLRSEVIRQEREASDL